MNEWDRYVRKLRDTTIKAGSSVKHWLKSTLVQISAWTWDIWTSNSYHFSEEQRSSILTELIIAENTGTLLYSAPTWLLQQSPWSLWMNTASSNRAVTPCVQNDALSHMLFFLYTGFLSVSAIHFKLALLIYKVGASICHVLGPCLYTSQITHCNSVRGICWKSFYSWYTYCHW